jgi:hypothetical protein
VAYRDVHPKKLEFLLAKGTHEGELRKFFSESRVPLLSKGARIQNLPHRRDERIRAICEKFPAKTDAVLRTWFQKNISTSESAPIADVVAELELYEQSSERIPDEDAGRLARAVLVNLFSDTADENLLTFLRRTPGSSKDALPTFPSEASRSDDSAHEGANPPKVAEPADNTKLAELLNAIYFGDEDALGNALLPYSEELKSFVHAIACVRSGDLVAASQQMLLLARGSPELALAEQALASASHRRGRSQTGIRALLPKRFEQTVRESSYEIVGICTNESESRAIFVQPQCVVHDGELFSLTREKRTAMFPDSGDVMTYRAPGRHVPQRKEYVRWKVTERDVADGKTRFHYDSDAGRLIEVFRLPVPSTDPDEIRQQIRMRSGNGRGNFAQPAMFVLADGLVIYSSKASDASRDEAFEQPWSVWNSLDTWLIEGRQFCLELPDAPASQLDLSPLEVAFKKLLKSLESEQRSTLTKVQVRELASLIRDNVVGQTAVRAKRITSFLDQIALDEEAIETLLPLLNAREEVRDRVEQEVAKELQERQKEKSGLAAEVAILKRKRDDLAREGKELERENRRQVESVNASVRQVFARAVEEGVATLASAEMFQKLAGRSAPHSEAEQLPVRTAAASAEVDLRIVRDALTFSQSRERLVGMGMKQRHATGLLRLSLLMMDCGIALILRGRDSRQYAQVLARTGSESCGILEIPMGLVSGTAVRRALSGPGQAVTLAILDADLSPFEAYGPPLLDMLFESALADQAKAIRIVFSCSGGEMSVPLSNSAHRVGISFDLDSIWDAEARAFAEIEEDSIPLLAQLRRRLQQGLVSLESAERELVERALVSALDSQPHNS